MAIRGNIYRKTAWAFQERPVASSKLNTWDDRIESAVEMLCFLLNQAWGGGSGVLRGVTVSDLAVQSTDPVGLSVVVQPGWAFINALPYQLAEAVTTLEPAVPSAQDRIDLVQARLESWDINVKTGTEAASPEAPDPDEDCIALAQLYLRPGMTSIKETDDATNGYIIDERAFL